MEQDIPYVLMLEDDSDDRYITQQFFNDQGYNIGLQFVVDAAEVMPKLEDCIANGKSLPRLMILDKNVPPKNSMEVVQEIKSDPRFQLIPIVMVSGLAYPGEIEEAYRCGVSSFITKPVSHELTARKIDTCIRYWFEVVDLPQQDISTTHQHTA
ncbi:MAG: response regulator [Bacteroidota bacterium]